MTSSQKETATTAAATALAAMHDGTGLPANLTIEDLAEYSRQTPEGVRTWVKRGTGPRSFKVGKRRLFARDDVLAFFEAARERAA